MIKPMEKLTILVFHREKDSFLASLQELGLMHISLSSRDYSDEVLHRTQDEIERCELFLKFAAKVKAGKKTVFASAEAQPFTLVENFEKNRQEQELLGEQLDKLARQIRNLEPWGDFDRERINQLKTVGINLRFFVTPIKKFDSVAKGETAFEEISRDRIYVYFVVLEKGAPSEIDADEFFYPETDLKTLLEEERTLRKKEQELEQAILELCAASEIVSGYLNRIKSEFLYLNISQNLSSAAEGKVYVVSGWIPKDKKPEISQFLDYKEVYHYFSAPQPQDNVPILLQNNAFSRLFEPITKLFALPHYAELDLTGFFAPFFTLFFGFCLGDAGYGLLIVIGAFIAFFKLAPDKKPLAALLMVFGGSTVLVGIITGNMFGVDLSRIEGVKNLVLFNQDQLFNVAIILGVVQVFFGMGVKVLNRIRQFGFLSSVSTIGWIFLLGGLIGLFAWPQSIYAVYAGIAMILLFNDLKSNIFIRIGKGLWELYGITGVFGDVLSYIRLFALGISGSILGLVVNDIAFQMRAVPGIGFFLTFIILIVGHLGNMALSMLSSFVHPLRLTFVEFYKNAGFEGGGRAYQPFSKIK